MKHRIEQPEAEEDDRNFHQQIATIKLKMSSDDEKNFPSTNALLQFFPPLFASFKATNNNFH